ncbi:MAG: hypothetical protein KDK37_19035, partial [Leptospiraceae bacterium]|nr:hypothetical protein [Leptospiraceae bacterium]
VKARIGDRFKNLFWLLTEAIDNAIKHSEARWLQIKLAEKDSQIMLSVTDNGEGLVRKAGSTRPKQGKGLQAIRILSQSMAANLSLDKGPRGYGTSLNLRWDLDRLEIADLEKVMEEV